MNKASFDSVAIEYDFISEIFNNNDYFLSNLSAKRTRALDVGCGSGILMQALSNYYDEVIGIDISEEMLAIGKSKRNADHLRYIKMNATDITLDGTFDFIVSRTTLHHIENKSDVIMRLKSLLAEQGKLVIVDNVSKVPTPKRTLNIAGAYIELIPNIMNLGYKKAMRVLRHSLSKEWLDHLDGDIYLSESETKDLYEATLPGCHISRFACFTGVVWEKNS